jgi:hypothetical protein
MLFPVLDLSHWENWSPGVKSSFYICINSGWLLPSHNSGSMQPCGQWPLMVLHQLVHMLTVRLWPTSALRPWSLEGWCDTFLYSIFCMPHLTAISTGSIWIWVQISQVLVEYVSLRRSTSLFLHWGISVFNKRGICLCNWKCRKEVISRLPWPMGERRW